MRSQTALIKFSGLGQLLFPVNWAHVIPPQNIKSMSVHLAVIGQLLIGELFLELHDTRHG